ncbi:unnamed protein product, partial [Schistosoma mattheei]
APVILQFSNEPWIVLYEEPSTIVCHAIGNPTPSIYWIDQHGQIISKTEQLNSAVFNKILIKDELGKFTKDNWTINVTCTAENIMGSIEKSLKIEFYCTSRLFLNPNFWARDLREDNYEILCPDGRRAEVHDWITCNLGKISSNVVVTANYKSENERTNMWRLLQYGQEYYSSDRYVIIHMIQ